MEDKKLLASIFSVGLGDVNCLVVLWQRDESRRAGTISGYMPEQPGSYCICVRINETWHYVNSIDKTHLANCGSKRMS